MSAVAHALTDKDFLAAYPDDQIAYLSTIDPDFAKGKPEDQRMYLNHILAPGRLAKAAQPTEFEKERTPIAGAEKKLGDVNRLMTLAMTGQGRNFETEPMLSPGEREQAAAGRKAGTIAGGSQVALAPIEAAVPAVTANLPRISRFIAPIARTGMGAAAGGAAGRYAGGVLGPEAEKTGGILGMIGGGMYGALGGVVPTKGSILRSIGSAAEAELPATEAATLKPIETPAPRKIYMPEEYPAARERVTMPAERTAQRGPLKPIQRMPEEIYQRPIKAAPGAGTQPAPAEMHPDELAEIRKEAGKPAMTAEEAHRYRVNKMASSAAAAKPSNELGEAKRAGEANRLEPADKAKSPRGYFNPGRSEPVKLNDLVDQAAGVKPLRPEVPLIKQLTSKPAASLEEVDPVKAKYPDPAVRQMVRANGEAVYEAAKKDPATVKAIHDLTRVELRNALINAGEDMGQITVSNSKFAGEGSIAREEAFNRLLRKGLTPEKILELAKKPLNE